MFAFGDRVLKFRDTLRNVAAKARRDLVSFEVQHLTVKSAFEVDDFGLNFGGAARRRRSFVGLIGDIEDVLPVFESLRTEECCPEKAEHSVVQPRLVQVDALRMIFRDVRRPLMRGLARVVGGGVAVVSPHPKPANAAMQEATIEVVRARARTCVGRGDALA
ncbi:MAG: hypothetical protein ABSC31_06585 [Acidimicrobiales bacterium]